MKKELGLLLASAALVATGCGSASATPEIRYLPATPGTSDAAGTPVPGASVELKTGLTKEQMDAAHEARLRSLDPIYRTQGTEAWLKAAGFQYDSFTFVKDARQIEEETLPDGTIVASGVQVRVTHLTNTQFPNGFTTDQPVAQGESFQPDPKNPSRLWTNVPSFSGKATLYVDFSNWGQFNPLAK